MSESRLRARSLETAPSAQTTLKRAVRKVEDDNLLVVALAKRGVPMTDLVQKSEEWAEVLSH
jgi:hypothetical protein